MKILVLGGSGKIGSIIAKDLYTYDQVKAIGITGNHIEKAGTY